MNELNLLEEKIEKMLEDGVMCYVPYEYDYWSYKNGYEKALEILLSFVCEMQNKF